MRTLLLTAPLVACLACSTQLWPRPMEGPDPLPPGVDEGVISGSAEVLLLRLAGPVQLRRPPSATSFPLTFYRKRQRAHSGSWVYCGAGGRAELLWTADGSNVIIFDEAVVRLGDPDQREPDLSFAMMTRLEIQLGPGSIVEFAGGAQLSGPADGPTGPYLVEQIYEELVRVFNRSKRPAYLAFRDAQIVLAPGERIDLPLLEVGAIPFDLGGPPREVESAGVRAELFGALEPQEDENGLRARATGPGVLKGNGVSVRLAAGEEAALLPLSPPSSGP